MPEATWKPHEKHGPLTMQSDLPDSVYAFPKQRKEPLTDAQHVRNAIARFDQVIDVSDADRALAFANIEKAANYYDVNLAETSWHDLGIHPQKNCRDKSAARKPSTNTDPGKRKSFADNRRDNESHIFETHRRADGPGVGRKPFGRSSFTILTPPVLSLRQALFGLSEFKSKKSLNHR
jgi:hypothetical protein